MPVTVTRSGGHGGSLARVGAWGRAALRAVDRARAELSVVLCDDAFIAPLNHEWRGVEGATDVLSFPQDGPEGPLLGDIVISTETAARQAGELGHDVEAELRVLLVHGLCHLLGHDHHDAAEATAMQGLEQRVLAALDAGDQRGLVARATT